MRRNFKWVVCSVSFIIFLILSILVLYKKDILLDSIMYNFISKFISSNLTNIIKFITYFGSSLVVILITIFTFIFFKNKKYAIFMSSNLIIITIIQFLLKNIFSRSRPVDLGLIEENGYSFPSGHSLTSMAFYGFIIYLIYNSNINKTAKSIFIIFLGALILLIGISRVYLGVHYFTDVIGGFTFSISYLIVYISIIKNKLN